MLRAGILARAAAVAGGFSSATFTGDEPPTSTNTSSSSSNTSSSEGNKETFGSAAFTGQTTTTTRGDQPLQRPTIETYRAMSDAELTQILRTRARQVRQLRTIYENFHYEADKCFRKMIFDYHDKAIGLSAAHGKMQTASLQINREVVSKLREEQERLNRDRRIILFLSGILGLIFWIWVRRHYVERKKLDINADTLVDRALEGNFVTCYGAPGAGLFSSRHRSARVRETEWEKERRARRTQSDGQSAEGVVTADQALLRGLKESEG